VQRRPSNLLTSTMRILRLLFAASCAIASNASGQTAPAAGPLILLLPASTRATALGNFGVAGRDEYALFYNPAQIASTSGIFASATRYGTNGTAGAVASGTTVGSLTFGWGVQLVEFKAGAPAAYPFAPSDLVQPGQRDAMSFVAGVGMNYVFKGFRTGLGVKYAEDRVSGVVAGGVRPPSLKGLMLADLGVSHPLFSGTAALAVQNLGDGGGQLKLPTRTTLGWARQGQVGPIDLAVGALVSETRGWVSEGGGIEAGYGWIEGWSVALRAGARRMETAAQRPMSVGGNITGDRLSLDYALEFFEHGQYAHHFTIRWR
jgi:hypothetical protein